MSLFTNFENAIKAELIRSEQAVLDIVTAIANGEKVVLADLQGAGNWIATHAGQIEAGITGAATLAEALNAPISPALLIAANAANSSLQAFATAHNSGQSDAQSIVSGFVAYKQSAGLISQVTATSIQNKASATLSAVATAANAVATASSQSTNPTILQVGQIASATAAEVTPSQPSIPTPLSPSAAQLGFPGV